MKTKFRMLVKLFLISLIFASCKVSYLVSYQTDLENSPNESLQFKDSIISVSFIPIPNGILFDIENLSKNNLYLIWDRSYFIEPSGSSSKLLNTDILETNSAIRDKENYESVIPKGAHFNRFTSPANKISLFSMYTSTSLYNEVTKTITSYADYSQLYLTSTYWNLSSKMQYNSKKEIPGIDKVEIATIQKFIIYNNKLAVCFTIKNKEKEIEYHFRFPIKKVEISKKLNDDLTYILSYELTKDNGFNATKIGNK